MHELGLTRSAYRRDHLLQTPDTFVRAPLPGMLKATAVVHAAPSIGAKFMQYTAEFEAGGTLAAAAVQRFVYVLEGEVLCPSHGLLHAGDYAYFPDGCGSSLSAITASRAAVIEKPYQILEGAAPPLFFAGSEDSIEAQPLMGDPGLAVRALVPGW